MTNRKAIDVFNKWMDCKDAYQADPSCDGNCYSCEYYASAEEEREAMTMAISALEKQEKDRWIPVTESEPTETGLYLVTENTVVERKWTTIMRIAKCEVSKLYDGRVDVCWRGFGGRVLAWRPLPEPYKAEEES